MQADVSAGENFDLHALLRDAIEAHSEHFDRHHITVLLTLPDDRVPVHAVKGMVVQVLENLIANSVYWLDLERKRRAKFEPTITIKLDASTLITFEDNGPGISRRYADRVFELFFSLKEKSKRRGMGLYIARECAQFNGGSLTLDPEPNHRGKLSRFTYAVTRRGPCMISSTTDLLSANNIRTAIVVDDAYDRTPKAEDLVSDLRPMEQFPRRPHGR